ncbi:uncharacterized protein BXZ73DRAFT_79516 [Epithele typhae]|uniref:uncharacterized protein n=1 Tax=Epithele typhae TaxID=378194 RepID=UPI002007E846|nr:uncharacterized protein BXZ73DRAFT_79516 [Epithele typhae]KAH9923454.1 hypothetical protein BXZ73DRAFT_79516 [Epithele typhae]
MGEDWKNAWHPNEAKWPRSLYASDGARWKSARERGALELLCRVKRWTCAWRGWEKGSERNVAGPHRCITRTYKTTGVSRHVAAKRFRREFGGSHVSIHACMLPVSVVHLRRRAEHNEIAEFSTVDGRGQVVDEAHGSVRAGRRREISAAEASRHVRRAHVHLVSAPYQPVFPRPRVWHKRSRSRMARTAERQQVANSIDEPSASPPIADPDSPARSI